MGANSYLAILRFSIFILWLLAFPMNGFLMGKTGPEHAFLFFVIPHALALLAINFIIKNRIFPMVVNAAIGTVIAGTALFPYVGYRALPLLVLLGVAAAGLLVKLIGDMGRVANPPLAGAICMAGGNLALLLLMKLPLTPQAIHLLLALLLFVPLFSATPRCGPEEKDSFAGYLPFLFVYELVSGVMYGSLMAMYNRHAFLDGIELLFYAGTAFIGAYLVRKGKDTLLVLGILGGMLSFSLFQIRGGLSVNLSMFAFQSSAGFIDLFILVLLFTRADSLRAAGPVFGTACAGIAGGYIISGNTNGEGNLVVGSANLILTVTVFIFVFFVRKRETEKEARPGPEEMPVQQPGITLSPILKKRLSEREQAVLDCVLRKKTFRETAEDLSLSESSVKTYMKRIYEKTGVTGKEELFTMLANSGGGTGGEEG
ncbi:MAG TPA: helix-turn-helix transcriptional regulator [Desulfuromonadaceae bacterium]